MTGPSRSTTAAAVAFIALGAWLRLYGLQWMEFKTDEQLALTLATDLLERHPWSSDAPWPTHGMLSSGWVANAPLFTWIVALFWAATHHPVGVTALIASVNALSLVPLWYWARQRMDEQRALLVLALVAVSPFAVLFSRKIWTQDLLLPGLVAVLWGIEWLRLGRLWRGIIVLAVGVLLTGQLHQSGTIAIALLPLAAAIQYIAEKHRRPAIALAPPSPVELVVLVIAVAANVFFWWPYLTYLASIDWMHLPAREMADSLAPGLLRSLVSQIVPWDLVAVFRADRDAFVYDTIRNAVFRLSIWLSIPLCIYGVWRWLRAPLTLPVIGIWWWLVIIAFAFARIPARPSYVLILSPLPALLAAGAFDGALPSGWMTRWLTYWRWTYAMSLLALTILTGSWLAARGGAGGDYGVTFDIREGQARQLHARLRTSSPLVNQRAEVSADDPSSFECHSVPREVSWLVGWLHGGPAPNLKDFMICDAWVGVGGDERVYRWTIQHGVSR